MKYNDQLYYLYANETIKAQRVMFPGHVLCTGYTSTSIGTEALAQKNAFSQNLKATQAGKSLYDVRGLDAWEDDLTKLRVNTTQKIKVTEQLERPFTAKALI